LLPWSYVGRAGARRFMRAVDDRGKEHKIDVQESK
jgi:hypothetical protein